MAIQQLSGQPYRPGGEGREPQITDANEAQGPQSAYEICYVRDENAKLPIKQPTGE